MKTETKRFLFSFLIVLTILLLILTGLAVLDWWLIINSTDQNGYLVPWFFPSAVVCTLLSIAAVFLSVFGLIIIPIIINKKIDKKYGDPIEQDIKNENPDQIKQKDLLDKYKKFKEEKAKYYNNKNEYNSLKIKFIPSFSYFRGTAEEIENQKKQTQEKYDSLRIELDKQFENLNNIIEEFSQIGHELEI